MHHANTIFLTSEEKAFKEKDEEYKEQLTKQVTDNVLLRRLAGALFRQRALFIEERYLYYPVPYLIFTMCTRAYELIQKIGEESPQCRLLFLIIHKSLAALTLVEDSFLDSAYMPCRAVIEMFAKLMLFRRQPHLFSESERFAYYEFDKNSHGQTYSDEFNEAYSKRKNQSRVNKVAYLHYGFVDSATDYHKIIFQNPYSMAGIIHYLKSSDVGISSASFDTLIALYTTCHGYIHGNVTKAHYPIIHYFDISLILGEIVPTVYSLICEDYGIEKTICGQDVLSRFEKEFAILKSQYDKRSTKNFEIEKEKQHKYMSK